MEVSEDGGSEVSQEDGSVVGGDKMGDSEVGDSEIVSPLRTTRSGKNYGKRGSK
jgi:hypothetical protein